jgi:hypothetical protein
MKTKKSDEFITAALKKPRTHLALVGKGSSWTIYEGTDVDKATPGKGEEVIHASCQKKQTALNLLVVGGSNEITVFKTKVFAAQIKKDPKAITFKPVSKEEHAELDKLQSALDSDLVQQVSKSPPDLQKALLPLLNEAKHLLIDGEIAAAKLKVQELQQRLGSQDVSGDESERKVLLEHLQGSLVGKIARLKGPQRDEVLKEFNDAIKLVKTGDLQVAKKKVADLQESLDPESGAETFKERLHMVTTPFLEVVKKGPINKSSLETAMHDATESSKGANFKGALTHLDVVEDELSIAEDFVALRDEKDLNKKIQLCDNFLLVYFDRPKECAEVEDILAQARKDWGVGEAMKAYEMQMKEKSDPQYNPKNKFAPKHDQGQKDEINRPLQVAYLAQKYGLSEGEVLAIRRYTAADYKYINPAIANQKDHPELQKPDKAGNPIDWMDAQNKPDPSRASNWIQKKLLQRKLRQYNAKQKKSLSEEGSLHAGMMMEAFKKLPKKTGTLYRGARMNPARFNSEYAVGKEIPIEAFISQSVNDYVARGFANGVSNFPLPPDATVSVFVKVDVQDARDVSEISVLDGAEAEWLLPPGGKLKVEKIEDDPVKDPGIDGAPRATAWHVVKMKQIPG